MILISEGLIFEGLGSETDELASIAADSRATLDILLLDVPQFDASQSRRPTTPREDRDLQVTGLEQLAGASRGDALSHQRHAPTSRSIASRGRSTAITCSASSRAPTIATAAAIASA